MPVVPAAAVTPAAIVMRVPVVPAAAISPAAVVVRMPVMPVMWMVVTVTVVMAMPAMAPFVADVIGLLDV